MKKNVFRLFGIIALIAVIGFSFAACGDDSGPTGGGGGGGGNDGGYGGVGGGGGYSGGGTANLGASTLTARAVSSSSIQLSWTSVSGAAGYKVYNSYSSSSGFGLLGTERSTSATNTNLSANTTIYYVIVAYAADGTEGAPSNIASATTLSSTPSPTLSINGVWKSTRNSDVLSIYDNKAVWTEISGTAWKEAERRGNVGIGALAYRNITSTGNSTWSGQTSEVNTSTYAVSWGGSVTLALSANGQTLTTTYSTESVTWTRKQ